MSLSSKAQIHPRIVEERSKGIIHLELFEGSRIHAIVHLHPLFSLYLIVWSSFAWCCSATWILIEIGQNLRFKSTEVLGVSGVVWYVDSEEKMPQLPQRMSNKSKFPSCKKCR